VPARGRYRATLRTPLLAAPLPALVSVRATENGRHLVDLHGNAATEAAGRPPGPARIAFERRLRS
jgi:hypothetical protein